MTKREVDKMFREDIMPLVLAKYSKSDKVAMREAWNNYTDALCKDGQITSKQYETWGNPF